MGDPHGIGVVGLGVISRAYLDTLADHPAVRVVAVADLDAARAVAAAARIPGAEAVSVERLLHHPDVATVLNLTIPAAHEEISGAAITAGRNVYVEKPLTVTFPQGRSIIDRAASAGVHVGCAPDTVLGTGTQTARAAIDGGLIGRPLSASAVMVTPGHERWHPEPDFYYAPGGGPLMDMGPYYISALIHLLGPVRAVIGAASRLRDARVIGSGPRLGQRIPVEVPTHVTGVLEHVGGALTTLTTSFDGVATTAAPIEVHGEDGTLAVPDPNTFDGEVRHLALDGPGWRALAPRAGYVAAARGIGLIDLIRADQTCPPRASGELALHVLDIMTALLRSAAEGRRIELTTAVDRPMPVPFTPAEDWLSAPSSGH
ncbi:Gfo/Idh/MocA family oxidoreductase [Solwaraspora sp. WMMD791]|uniref:Gfo/Idh/MocA family protein n=1 Tax=Solwaraspora sp. WMMD791 TaxID=3016086 RepID=UPI00249B2E5F|nr:Gfo/Idh/MocA family oxidoreductase [Solwaraspora sp. WMMD791]WFE28239.1 Gfo/Idh/MocA family oxidoreductase [Solwaraspora sp. WMMD791]